MIEYIEKTREDGTVEQLSKLQAVQEEMQEFLDDLARQKKVNEMLDKPLKIAWKPRIYSKIESVLLKLERPISNTEAFAVMTAEMLYKCFIDYCDLCCWIESKVGIPYNKDKTEFCNFAAITETAFSKFKTKGDPHQREAVDDIEKRLSNSLNVAMESGEVKAKAGELKQRSKNGIGYSMQVTGQHEPVIAIPVTNNSFTSVEEIMSGMAVVPTKQLGSGRK